MRGHTNEPNRVLLLVLSPINECCCLVGEEVEIGTVSLEAIVFVSVRWLVCDCTLSLVDGVDAAGGGLLGSLLCIVFS